MNNSHYIIKGRVIKGDGLGRQIGYPTANLTHNYFRWHSVPNGIYAGWARVRQHTLKAIAIIGVDHKIEIYLLDWRGSLYGEYLIMQITHYLRPVKRYRGAVALRQQIARDIKKARQVLLRGIKKGDRVSV